MRIGGDEYSVELAAALLFARLKQGAEAAGAPLDRAVVTIPANSRGLARYRTKLCAGLAGIDVAALINEPTAAAMAHSISAGDDQNILVFDWGGGTLDVTVLETVAGVFIERASKGIQRSGGHRPRQPVRRRAAAARSRAASAGARPSAAVPARSRAGEGPALAADRRRTSSCPAAAHSRSRAAQLEEAIRPKIEETRGADRPVPAGPQARGARIDHVVLVGGSSKIPAVRDSSARCSGRSRRPGSTR